MIQFILGSTLLIGLLILIGSVFVGIFGFNPRTAANIRAAEDQVPLIVEEVRRIHVRRPDTFHHDRLDRHPVYLGIHIATWGYAWCIFLGSSITSNVSSLDHPTRIIMATCFLVGSSLAISGAVMGLRIRRMVFLRGIADNTTSSMLSDDIRLPYAFGSLGMFAMTVSFGMYSTTSFRSTLGSLGGWITGCSAFACVILLVMFVQRIRRFSRARELLINEAVKRIIERGSHATG